MQWTALIISPFPASVFFTDSNGYKMTDLVPSNKVLTEPPTAAFIIPHPG